MLGAVNQPKAVDFANDLTLITALADAQGLAKNAYSQRVIIVRDSLSDPKVAVVNFDAIVGGKAKDVVLEPQDIVWVPNSPFDRIDQYLGDVVSVRAHRRRPPHDDAHRLRVRPLLVEVAAEHVVGEPLPRLPGKR